MNTKEMILSAVFAAVLSILSIISFPVGTIPITLGIMGILFNGIVLPQKISIISTVLFILMGFIGLPVFSGMQGGAGVLTGPSGGYILSYIPMVLIVSVVSKYSKKFKGRFLILLSSRKIKKRLNIFSHML